MIRPISYAFGLLLAVWCAGASAPARAESREARPRGRHEVPAVEPEEADVAPLPTKAVKPVRLRIPLSELTSGTDALKLSDRASETFSFSARADQVLLSAELSLPSLALERIDDFASLDVLLNGERVESLTSNRIARDGIARVTLNADLLASSNTLELRLVRTSDPNACGLVPSGTWQPLSAAFLTLSSADLPLPSELSVLPLPFFDPEFDRQQRLHFVLPAQATAAQLEAAAQVAGWFALRGKGRLSFVAQMRCPRNIPWSSFLTSRRHARSASNGRWRPMCKTPGWSCARIRGRLTGES